MSADIIFLYVVTATLGVFSGFYLICTKGKEGYWYLTFFLLFAFMSAVERYRETVKERNREVCSYMGTVEDSVCAVAEIGGKFPRKWAECRVLLSNGQKLNLTPETLALKGDKLLYCKNTEERFAYLDHHKVEP